MMTEPERRGSPEDRWPRWYMWLTHGGGIQGVIAVVVVIVAMAAAPSRDGETVASHHNMATVSPERRQLYRVYPSGRGKGHVRRKAAMTFTGGE